LVERPNADLTGQGLFALPSGFDSVTYASSYHEEGHAVSQAQQSQPLAGLPFSSPGWAVWQGDDKKPHKVLSGGKNYILMFRPMSIQNEVNEAYAMVSRDRVTNDDEVAKAAAAQYQQPEDKILTEKDLDKIEGSKKK
jgi:hypothetical protein